ncbi:NAD(P)-binding protein [Suillus hirtellus]|nr:NAD(P)-binding protein [Suillus hirtellus]
MARLISQIQRGYDVVEPRQFIYRLPLAFSLVFSDFSTLALNVQSLHTTKLTISSPPTMNFSGKCIIVIEGDHEIGLVYSIALAKAGARVAIIYRSNKDAPKVAEDLKKEFGVEVRAYKCDVINAEQTIEMFEFITNDLGPVTGLIANASASVVKPVLALTTEDIKHMYNVNVLGVFNSAVAAAKLWKGKNLENLSIVISSPISSRIINQAATNKPPTQVLHKFSKAAVSSFTKALAAEWAEAGHNIRVNEIAPEWSTDQTDNLPDKVRQQIDHNPRRKFATIANQALFLLSENSNHMTGGEYPVDGGW